MGTDKIAYMRSDVVVSFWDAKLVDDKLDGYILGYGINNSFGDDKLFAGINLVFFQLLDESDGIHPVGIDTGLEIGMLIPVSKHERILLASGYSYFYLQDLGYTGFHPSARIGINSNRFTFSVGYNFKYGMFSTLGIHQTF